ncbi:GvpL/GvpF family gas vesicle protein [Streptomyces sp. NPDC085614]|uniref:GvpL/GvpF family gas vesicle protein n=1 Tax=Streptomyces sp. NPDC085614 TaxID=3365733 RepID=UPI0037D68982
MTGDRAGAPPTLTYVYAVVPADDEVAEAVGPLRGVAEAAVLLLTEDAASGPELAFAASRVPAEDFGESALKQHFEDVGWLEDTARAHHGVVEALAARTAVLPLRMATVYQDAERARQALSRRRKYFAERLALLRDHTEYGVKIYLAPSPSSSSEGEPDDGPPGSGPGASPDTATPGRSYLRQRRAQHAAREARDVQAGEAAAHVEAAGARHATGVVRHPVQRSALSGPLENILNNAYLVPDGETERFRAAVLEAAAPYTALRIELTGPWAPYSFAMPPEPEQGSREQTDDRPTP